MHTVRPEQIRFVPSLEAASAGDVVAAGTVTDVQYLGADSQRPRHARSRRQAGGHRAERSRDDTSRAPRSPSRGLERHVRRTARSCRRPDRADDLPDRRATDQTPHRRSGRVDQHDVRPEPTSPTRRSGHRIDHDNHERRSAMRTSQEDRSGRSVAPVRAGRVRQRRRHVRHGRSAAPSDTAAPSSDGAPSSDAPRRPTPGRVRHPRGHRARRGRRAGQPDRLGRLRRGRLDRSGGRLGHPVRGGNRLRGQRQGRQQLRRDGAAHADRRVRRRVGVGRRDAAAHRRRRGRRRSTPI